MESDIFLLGVFILGLYPIGFMVINFIAYYSKYYKKVKMIIYWYPLVLGIIFSIFIFLGFKRRNKLFVIVSTLFPAFFASPFFTVTRGAAGAITASDITGVALLLCLPMLPFAWKSPYRISSVRLLIILLTLFGFSIWVTGVLYNFQGIGDAAQNLRVSMGIPLPILMACFRTFKLLSLFSYIVFFYKVIFSENEMKWIMRTIISGCLVLAIAQILTRLGITDLSLAYGDTGGVYVGPRILGHTKASLGRLLAVGGLLVLSQIFQGSKLISISSIMILTGGLILSGSRGGMLVLVIGIILVFFLGRGRGVLIGGIGAIVIIVAGYFALQYSDLMQERLVGTFDTKTVSTASHRTLIWGHTLSTLASNIAILIFGVGGFNFSYANSSFVFEHAHNDTLTVLTELGIFGAVLFLAWLFSLTKVLYRNIWVSKGIERWKDVCFFSIMIGLLFASLFEPTFYPNINTLPPLRIVFPLILAISLFQYKHHIAIISKDKKQNRFRS